MIQQRLKERFNFKHKRNPLEFKHRRLPYVSPPPNQELSMFSLFPTFPVWLLSALKHFFSQVFLMKEIGNLSSLVSTNWSLEWKLKLLLSGSSLIHKQQQCLRFGNKKAHSTIPGVNETHWICTFPSEVPITYLQDRDPKLSLTSITLSLSLNKYKTMFSEAHFNLPLMVVYIKNKRPIFFFHLWEKLFQFFRGSVSEDQLSVFALIPVLPRMGFYHKLLNLLKRGIITESQTKH